MYQHTVLCSVQVVTYKTTVADVRTDVLTGIMHSQAWTELKRQCSETCVPDLAAQIKQFFHLAVTCAFLVIRTEKPQCQKSAPISFQPVLHSANSCSLCDLMPVGSGAGI